MGEKPYEPLVGSPVISLLFGVATVVQAGISDLGIEWRVGTVGVSLAVTAWLWVTLKQEEKLRQWEDTQRGIAEDERAQFARERHAEVIENNEQLLATMQGMGTLLQAIHGATQLLGERPLLAEPLRREVDTATEVARYYTQATHPQSAGIVVSGQGTVTAKEVTAEAIAQLAEYAEVLKQVVENPPETPEAAQEAAKRVREHIPTNAGITHFRDKIMRGWLDPENLDPKWPPQA